jgi:flagellar basal-body rod protein FlgG
MMRAFSTSATGMMAQETLVNVIANNLANVNTTGFKRSQIEFQDLLYAKMKEPGTEVAAGVIAPTGTEVGNGVRVSSTMRVFAVGELNNTQRNLDVAIQGDGFLQVLTPSGSTRYTRDGALMVNANGQLVTASGYQVEPAVSIPADASAIEIAANGGVNVTDSEGVTSVVGTIQLARFVNPSGLTGEGDNLYLANEASGAAVIGTPGENGLGQIQAGFLEKSNVQMVTELVNLITAQRAYEINSRAIKAGDEMLQNTNNIF